MSTHESGYEKSPQFTPEAQSESIIPPNKIYEVLKALEGEPLIGDAIWSIGQRRDPAKSFSTEAKDGIYTTRTPGSEHPGMAWGIVIEITTNSLLTLSRRALIGGETQATKSDGYKERQTKTRDRILEFAALAQEASPSDEEHTIEIREITPILFREFIGLDINGELPDKAEVDEAFQNVVGIVTRLANEDPSERLAV